MSARFSVYPSVPITDEQEQIIKMYNVSGTYFALDYFKCEVCGKVSEPVMVNHETLSVFGSLNGGIFGVYCRGCKEIGAEEGAVFKVA